MNLEEMLKLAEDPTTPPEVLARIVRADSRTDQMPFLAALENPSLPFEAWKQHLKFTRAWNNPSAALYVAAGMVSTPCSVLIEHLVARRISTMQGRGTPFTPFAEQLLKDQLDGLWTCSLNLETAKLLDAAIQATGSEKVRYAGAQLSLLLAETVPLNEKQKRVLAGIKEVLAHRRTVHTLRSKNIPEPPHDGCSVIHQHTLGVVYGPQRVLHLYGVWTVTPNFSAALKLHQLLGTELDLNPVRQAFFEQYPTLWITEG